MKFIFSVLIFACSGSIFAAANDFVVNQRDNSDSSTQPRITTHPVTSGMLIYDSGTERPAFVTPGSGMSIGSGLLSLTNPPVNADWNASSGLAQILNKPSIPASQINSDWAALSGISSILNKPNLAAVAISGSYNDLSNQPTIPSAQVNADWNSVSGPSQILNKPSIPGIQNRSFSYPTRSLNACFRPSSTRDTLVNYNIDITTNLSLTSGQQGTVFLETFTDSGCTTGTQELGRFVNGQTGTLTVGLALTQNVTGSLNGIVPAGLYVKLRTQNNSGTPTFTARPGQEVLL